ncbi:uncharacterized protein LOC121600190 [Anopheles merus]|uniref:uncharacterized protein LOC121600190 n=1 Tax=Anopheles merus TaxID=30066 RepID=UPI001BE4168F|nr:uncharacterized protein LOC121600190 [Anopheles merus]
MGKVRLFVILAVLLRIYAADASSKIVLDSHFHYVVVGGDHVAESVGRYLAARDTNKTVLVLKGSRCNDVLEPSEPSKLWLEVSYLFAESAHYLGYEFIDPFLHGSKPGIAFTNQTASFIPPAQQLYAVDPNLKMLIDARPQRIIYNKASSTALGVEVSINYESQYIFATEELIIAGRCLEDYKLISQVDIFPWDLLSGILNNIPLEIALKSPIIAPIFRMNATPTSNHTIEPNKQPYCLLATELFIETLSKSQTNQTTATKEGIQPNAKVNIIVNERAPDRWIGFNPSVIYQDTATELNDPATVYKVLADTIDECMKIGTSQTFQQLGLSLLPHQPPASAKHSCPPDQPESVLCFVNFTLTTAYNREEDTPVSASLPELNHLTEDFRLKSSRKLRLLPFGLTSPFLEHWWKRIFSPRKIAREYTTRMGIVSRDLGQLNLPSMDALLDKLKERLKVIGSIPSRH